MIKNRTAQIIFQTVYVVLGIIGIIGNLGYFDKSFNSNFYVYYTNLSNYICFGVMLACLIQTAKANNKKEDGYVSTAPTFKFMCVIMILITCLVYNFLLSGEQTADSYFLSISNVLLHLVLPVMFVLDWILFYKHGKLRWFHPLLCTIMPIVYVIFILIRAGIMQNVQGALLYPYFFLDLGTLGWGGLIMWMAILFVVFVALGYILYFFDNFKYFKEKFKNRKNKKAS